MFYPVNEIDEALSCPECKKRFKDPRNLPCGHSFCNDCISHLSNDQQSIRCRCCREYYQVPVYGFPINKVIHKMLVKLPELVSDKILELESKFSNTQNRIEDFDSGILMEFEKAANMGYNVDVADQTSLSELIRKIDDEEKPREKPRSNSLSKVNKFYHKWDDFDESDIDQSKVIDAIEDAKNSLSRIEREQTNIKECLLSDKLSEWRRRGSIGLSSNSLGSADSDISDFFNIKDLKKVDLNTEILNKAIKLSFHLLKDDSVLVSKVNQNGFLHLFRMDIDGKILNEKLFKLSSDNYQESSDIGSDEMILQRERRISEEYDAEIMGAISDDLDLNESNDLCDRFMLSILNDKIVCYFHLAPFKLFRIKILNYNFECEKKIEIDYKLQALAANSKYIYCLTKSTHYNIIIYDSDFNMMNGAGRRRNSLSTYNIPKIVTQMKVNDLYYFFMNELNEIRIIDFNYGSMYKKFKMESSVFSIYSDSLLTCLDPVTNTLIYYDYSGNQIHQEKIIAIKPTLFQIDFNRIIFYKENDKSVYLKTN